jgi:hypothetical protein
MTLQGRLKIRLIRWWSLNARENGGDGRPKAQKGRAQVVDPKVVVFPISHPGGEVSRLIKGRRVSSGGIDQKQCVRRQ